MSTGDDWIGRLLGLPLAEADRGRLFTVLWRSAPERRKPFFDSGLSDAALAVALKEEFFPAAAASAGLSFLLLTIRCCELTCRDLRELEHALPSEMLPVPVWL